MAGTVAFHASAVSAGGASGGETVDVPGTVIAGDVMVLWDFAVNVGGGGLPTTVLPADFTSIANGSQTIYRAISSYKIAEASDASATLTGMNGSITTVKVLAVFRPSIAASAVTAQSVNSEATSGNPSSQSVTAASGAVPLIVFGCWGGFDQAVSPRSFSPAEDAEIHGGGNIDYLKYKIYNSSPADTTVDMDDEGTINALQSFYLEVTIPPSEVALDEATLAFAPQSATLDVLLPLSPATLAFASQDISLFEVQVQPVVLGLDAASLLFAAQSLPILVRMATAPDAITFTGQTIGLPLVITPAALRFAGIDVPVRNLTPTRNRAPLKLPAEFGRLASYWKGVRS